MIEIWFDTPKMDEQKSEYEYLAINVWEFKKNKNVTETVKKITRVYSKAQSPKLVFRVLFKQYVIKRWTQTKTFIRRQSKCFKKNWWNDIHTKVLEN